nr:RecName: Full=Uncharacterized protein SMPP12 [Nautilus macromphalus]
ALAQLLSLAR